MRPIAISAAAAPEKALDVSGTPLLNILWILTGGLWMAVAWLVAAMLMAITIIGLPWARAAFNIASYALLPFGRAAVRRDELEGQQDLGHTSARYNR